MSLRPRHRALSLTELLVASLIALVFMGSVVTAYVQIARAADTAEAEVRSHSRVRAAVDQIARDLLLVRYDNTIPEDQVQFVLVPNVLTYGDNIDNDGDGQIDEEVFDGFDTDGDWTGASDRHALIQVRREREQFVGLPDHGDLNVDEDVRFNNDRLTFRIPAEPTTARPARLITYELGSFDGQDHVLLRTIVTNPGAIGETTEIEPVVFDVVSLAFLAWNANDDVVSPGPVQRPYWQTSWDNRTITFPNVRPVGATDPGTPPFKLPASVLVRVTVNAERVPLADISGWPVGGRPLQTMTLETVVAINDVIKSPVYQFVVRPPS